MLRIILLMMCLFLLLPYNANAYQQWSSSKKVLYTISITSIVLDWGTTLDLVNRYDENYYETNKLLGQRPTRGEVNLFFVGTIGLTHSAAKYLSHPWDSLFLVSRIYLNGGAALHNLNIGLNFKF